MSIVDACLSVRFGGGLDPGLTPPPSVPPDDREQLESERAFLTQEIEDLSSRWNLNVGPARLSKNVYTQTFAKLYVCFNLVLWATGAVLILVGGNSKELGIAIVVGATFAFSAFLTEVWSQGMNRQAEAKKTYLNQLIERRTEVLQRLESRPTPQPR